MIAAHRVLRLAQIAGDFLALHHRGAALGQRGFLAVPGLELFQLVGGVAQIIRLARGALHARAVLVKRRMRGAARVP